MAFRVKKRKDGGLYFAFSGMVTPDDNMDARTKSFGRDLENLNDYTYLIGDYSEALGVTHSTEEVMSMIQSLKVIMQKNPKLVVAIVAPKDSVFGMSRMALAFYGNEDRFMIFRALDEAEIWAHQRVSTFKNQ